MVEKYNKYIKIYGTEKNIKETIEILNKLALTDVEAKDRLLIQEAIDVYDVKADILYDGNTVYGYKKLVAEINRMKKSGSIEKMTDRMYKFMSLNFDIAHYDKGGYIYYYNGSYNRMLDETEYDRSRIPGWQTDVKKIAEAF